MSERLLGRELVLSELFQPAVFLNALRQQTARAAGVPIDGLKVGACGLSRTRKLHDAPLVCLILTTSPPCCAVCGCVCVCVAVCVTVCGCVCAVDVWLR